jgi:hypothetical protein
MRRIAARTPSREAFLMRPRSPGICAIVRRMVQVNPLRNHWPASGVIAGEGSEYPAVVILLTTQHDPMLKRNLIGTAITRGRRRVVIVGQKKALAIAVKGRQTKRRWSKLKEWLEGRPVGIREGASRSHIWLAAARPVGALRTP